MSEQLIDTLMLLIDEALANLHTCTIAKVVKVNESTVNCKPVTNRVVDGKSIELPEFANVPVLFLQGGTSYTAYPIAVGDYALLLFTERCFDSWYNGQDFASPLQYRMHDYSDGIAIVGVNPLSKAIAIPTKIKQIGDTEQEGDYTRNGDMVHTGAFTINGDLTLNGNLICSGNITCATLTVGGVDMTNHVHGGVATGTSTTTGPQ